MISQDEQATKILIWAKALCRVVNYYAVKLAEKSIPFDVTIRSSWDKTIVIRLGPEVLIALGWGLRRDDVYATFCRRFTSGAFYLYFLKLDIGPIVIDLIGAALKTEEARTLFDLELLALEG